MLLTAAGFGQGVGPLVLIPACVPRPASSSVKHLYVIYITDALAKNRPKTGRMKPFCRNRETILKHTRRTSTANTGRQRRPGGIT
jgi:hypothetical protein